MDTQNVTAVALRAAQVLCDVDTLKMEIGIVAVMLKDSTEPAELANRLLAGYASFGVTLQRYLEVHLSNPTPRAIKEIETRTELVIGMLGKHREMLKYYRSIAEEIVSPSKENE